jgi:hypothetical protein
MNTLRLAGCLFALAFSFAPAAHAWHGYPEFQIHGGGDRLRYPGSGGIYYLGRQADFGMNCTHCHVGAPGRVRARLTWAPALTGGRYAPGTNYTITVDMVGETAGTGTCARRNTNAILAMFTNSAGSAVAGTIKGSTGTRQCGPIPPPATPYTWGFTAPGGVTTMVQGNCETAGGQGGTRWTMQWQAPMSGDVKLYLGMVDGDCVQRNGGAQTYDMDDVYMLEQDIMAGTMGWLQIEHEDLPQRAPSDEKIELPRLAVLPRRVEVA